MNSLALPGRLDADRVCAAVSVGALACGSVLAAVGGISGDLRMAVLGGVSAAAALMVLLVAGWVDGLALVVLSLAVPAPYSSATLRIAPAAAATAVVVIAWSLQRATDRHAVDLDILPRRAASGLLAAVLFSAMFALQKGPASREVLNWVFLLALLVVATTELVAYPRRLTDLALLIAVVMGVSGVLAVLQVIGVFPASFHWGTRSYARATLGFGWPNELGMYMALGLPFSVLACRAAHSWGGRLLARLGLAATILGLAATFSRGSWTAVMAGSLVLLFCGKRRFVLRLWIGAVIALIAMDAASGGAILARITSTEGDWVVGQRLALMLNGLLMFRAHPLVGVGPGGFGANLEHFGPQIPGLWDYVGSAQNLYVHMAAETGLIGLGALLFFFATSFRTFWRVARRDHGGQPDPAAPALRQTVLWSFTTACFIGFFEWPFAHGVGELIILVAAMGFALNAREAA